MFLNNVPQIITVIICDLPGQHLIIQIILTAGMTTSITWNFTFRNHSTIQIIIQQIKNPQDTHDMRLK